jgi:hypothetical protein
MWDKNQLAARRMEFGILTSQAFERRQHRKMLPD